MNGKSLTTKSVLIEQLKELVPQAFTEGKIDREKLLASLGEDIDFSNERYVLNWAGKSDCFRVLQAPSSKTLVPAKGESVNFDETENIFIEGENLEVLKVLQKSYFGKVKMIYIDPPYNTGNDSFIYPDKFSEAKDDYLKRVGDKDEAGYMTREGMFRKNSRENGQYHSNWLSMMYPRLFLARNLMRDDGVIFVSIDDNEVHNLRLIMNEIFGEENFASEFILKSNPRGSQSISFSANVHEYVLCYLKNINKLEGFTIKLSEEMVDEYNLSDNKGNYRLMGLRLRGGSWRKEDRPFLFFPIYVNPKNGAISLEKSLDFSIEVLPIKPSTNEEGTWRWSKDKLTKDLQFIIGKEITRDGKITWDIFQKDYLIKDGIQKETKPKTIWDEKEVNYQNGTVEFKQLFNQKDYFDFPKPLFIIQKMINMVCSQDDIILDFFSGSGTTAHAVLDLNREDGGNRKFICVQLPEACDEKSEAFKAGYTTIADIGKERIRRVIKKINDEESGKLGFDEKKQDLGFKVFKLAESSFKQWRSDIKTGDELLKQMEMFTDPVREGSTAEDMVYELILKSGKDINSTIEHINGVYYINGNEMALILEKCGKKVIDSVIKHNPQKVIALDRIFKDNDPLKTNTALQMKDSGIDFKTI